MEFHIEDKRVPPAFYRLIIKCLPFKLEYLLVHSYFKRILENYFRNTSLQRLLHPPLSYFDEYPADFNRYIVYEGWGVNAEPFSMKLSYENKVKFIFDILSKIINNHSTDIELFKTIFHEFPEQINYIPLNQILWKTSDGVFNELIVNGCINYDSLLSDIHYRTDEWIMQDDNQINRFSSILTHMSDDHKIQVYSLAYLCTLSTKNEEIISQMDDINFQLEPIKLNWSGSKYNQILKYCVLYGYPTDNYTFEDLLNLSYPWRDNAIIAPEKEKINAFVGQYILENEINLEDYILQALRSNNTHNPKKIEYILINFDVDVYMKFKDSLTLLHHAVLCDDNYFEIFLGKGYDFGRVRNKNGKTPYNFTRRKYFI